MRQLTHLYLGWCRLDDERVARLAAAPHLHGLELLDLSGNELGAVGARAILDSPWRDGLRQLHLKGNRFDARTVRRLKDAFRDRLYL